MFRGYCWSKDKAQSLSAPVLTSAILRHYALFHTGGAPVAVLALALLEAAAGYTGIYPQASTAPIKAGLRPSRRTCLSAQLEDSTGRDKGKGTSF